jgi:hypothetical protein
VKRFIRFPGGNVVDVESPEPTKTVMDPQLLLDDDMEIAIDNLCWDYAGFVHSPAPERTGSERKYDIARNVLRLRIAQLQTEARREGYRLARKDERIVAND